MAHRIARGSFWSLAGASLAFAAACGGDDGGESTDPVSTGNLPAQFTVTIENVTPEPTALSAGRFSTVAGTAENRAIGPGEQYELTVKAPPLGRLSIVSMLVPSNDYFLSTDPVEGMPLFVERTGQPLQGVVSDVFKVYDLGTEENQPLGDGSTQANNLVGQGQEDTNIGLRDMDTTIREAVDTRLPAVADMIELELQPNQTEADETTTFTVILRNISTATTLTIDSGTRDVRFSPGAWAVHNPEQTNVFFTLGQADVGAGMENLAEDGRPAAISNMVAAGSGIRTSFAPGAYAVYTGANPIYTAGGTATIDLELLAEDGVIDQMVMALAAEDGVEASGGFDIPVGTTASGPIGPGESYSFSFTAKADAASKLSFASMYTPSNDIFVSTATGGFSLFETRVDETGVDALFPVANGEITNLALWDAGTEVNQEPGYGADQPDRQIGQNRGETENGTVGGVFDGFNYPTTASMLKVSFTAVTVQ